jgi:hypothetical protein
LNTNERQSALQRDRDILFATIDYILQQVASEGLPKENFDMVALYYEHQRQLAEKNFQLRRLHNLQKQLQRLTEFPIRKCDISFNEYIKEKTGYDIDIFKNLEARVEQILAQNEIQNKKQFIDIITIHEVYKRNAIEEEKAGILKNLIINYATRLKPKKVFKAGGTT